MRLDRREQYILDHAEKFVATAFRDRGVFERIECQTIEEAREAARRLATDRGAMIYAIAGKAQALVETVR
jgi:hypothetical protein